MEKYVKEEPVAETNIIKVKAIEKLKAVVKPKAIEKPIIIKKEKGTEKAKAIKKPEAVKEPKTPKKSKSSGKPKAIETEKQNLLKNLKKIIHCTEFCTVCFENNIELLHLDHSVVVKDSDGDLLTLRELLREVFGNTHLLTSDFICEPCKSSAYSSFAFIHKAKKTTLVYAKYLDQLYKETSELTDRFTGDEGQVMIVINEIEKRETLMPRKRGRKGNYKCQTCNKILNNKFALRAHVNTHEKKSNKCMYCNKEFNSRGDLLIHTQSQEHKTNTPFGFKRHCSQCDYSATTADMLKAHINRVHLGIKPFKCQHCPMRYFDNSKLRIHLRTHTGLKLKVCDICGAHLKGPSALKKHKRRHTGELPFACTICDVRTICSTTLNRHIMKKHMEATIQCPLCYRKYHTMMQARAHVKKSHWKSKEKFDYTKLEGLSPKDYDFFRDRRHVVV